MIIVAGKLTIQEGKRTVFLDSSKEAMILARKTVGCRDFVVAADPLERDRVNVYEKWVSKAELLEFRGSGPDDAMTELIVNADVSEYEIIEK